MWKDYIQTLAQSEAAKVAEAMSTTNSTAYAVDGPMLTCAWDGTFE